MDYSQFLYMREELSLLLVIVVLFVADIVLCFEPKAKNKKEVVLNTAFPVIVFALHTLLNLFPGKEAEAFGGMYRYAPMMTVMKSVLNIGTLLVFLMAHEWLKQPDNTVKQGEFYLLTLFTLLGMYLMISSGHFLMFYIGLEMASVPMATLVAFDKYHHHSAEAGGKYILLALFSSSLLLYGLSLMYANCHTLYFNALGAMSFVQNPLMLTGLALFFAGMCFKISLVPFHLWTADVYQGAPVPVTGFLSVVSKGAAAFVFFLTLTKVFGSVIQEWQTLLFWIIMATITLANLFAIRQKPLKRFMAFSAISQAGYLMLGVIAGSPMGMTSMVYYLLVYVLANIGAFTVINIIVERSGKIGMDDYNGLYQTHPKLTVAMTLCLFSLAGIPPFAGFFSKFFIFMAAFKEGFHLLVLVALVNTVISLYYYLLVVKAMFINPNPSPIAPFRSDNYTRAALVICVGGVALLGLFGGLYQSIHALSF